MKEKIIFTPIAYVNNERKEKSDDGWGDILSEIELIDSFPIESLDGIDFFFI